jgi:outer membrane phospholipase A
MKVKRDIAIFAVIVGVSCSAFAEGDFLRLKFYEPSYLIFRGAENDQNALRAHFSFKYSLTPSSDAAIEPIHEVFFKYTGEFDFYAGTRDSGPVINRTSNPGLHYQYRFQSTPETWLGKLKWVNIGVEHRSDGQTTEVKGAEEAAAAQRAYDSGNHAFFDGVSRGSNYISAEAHTVNKFSDAKLSLYGKGKLYFTRDSDVTWGSISHRGASISDYDRIVALARYSYDEQSQNRFKSEASIEWTLGDSGLKSQSFNMDYMGT